MKHIIFFKVFILQGVLFKKLINRFYFEKRYKFYLLFLFSLFAGFFEYMGLVLIFQFVLFLSSPESIYCKKVLDLFSQYLGFSNISKISLILGFLIISIYIFKNIYMLFFTKFSNSILEDLSIKITTKVLKNLVLDDFLVINSIPKAQKLNIISKVTIVIWQYCLKFVNLVSNLLIAFVLIAYLYLKFTIPAFVATLFIMILVLIEYVYLKKQSDYQKLYYSKFHDDVHSILLSVINSFKEIKLAKRENFFIDKFEIAVKKYAGLNKSRNFNSVFHIYFTEISVMLTFALILVTLYLTSNFDNSLVLTSICTICVIILRLTPLINRAQSCLYCINSNEKIVLELLEFDNKFNQNLKCNRESKKMSFEKIIFENVCFSYDCSEKGLKNVNITINKGDFIGITGYSGAYKTTLALILAGLIKPKFGKVVNENNISIFDNLPMWQNNIAFLSQDFDLIFDNVYANVALGELYNESEIKNFVDKYDLSLNLDGNKLISNLSQGQKQRVALLSVLYQDKNVNILDEPTSSIDVVSEEKIDDILKKLKGEKTIISIAHRLNTLKNCDKIIFINKNREIAFDTFENLKNNNEDFRKMINLSSFS